MTTLEAIGFTVAGGSVVLAFSMGCFGFAVLSQSTLIAPRASARPGTVIYNPSPAAHSSQRRGNPWTGWIPWTLQFSYDELIHGIPGTGTRKGGMSGSMLRANMDQIVLLRFHAMCLRIVALLMILYCVILMPLNLSARCLGMQQMDDEKETRFYNGVGDHYADDSNATIITDQRERGIMPNSATAIVSTLCYNTTLYNLTNYERTTIANIPPLVASGESSSMMTNHDRLEARLYVTVFLFWIGTAYLFLQLRSEWIQILAMRRVYYLEQDIWGERREEHKRTLLYQEESARRKQKQQQQQLQRRTSSNHLQQQYYQQRQHSSKYNSNTSGERRHSGGRREQQQQQQQQQGGEEQESHLFHRDPWMPHPEQRDTVPNIALYSVLVGGLPSLPEHAEHRLDAQEALEFSKRDNIDWQLQLTSTFFDHCVPNQPGFSSSVAAVTIIPAAKHLAQAWRKWYKAASKLRRLRYIRELIAEKRFYEIEDSDDEDESSYRDDRYDPGLANVKEEEEGLEGEEESTVFDPEGGGTPTPRAIYGRIGALNKAYYREVLGSMHHNDYELSDSRIYQSLQFGPEQTAVYSREFAQAAAPCCPRGCHEHRLKRAGIDELIALEQQTVAEVHEANLALHEARCRAARLEAQPETTDIESGVGAGGALATDHTNNNNDGNDINNNNNNNTNNHDMSIDASTNTKTHRKSKSSNVSDCCLPEDLALEAQLFNESQHSSEQSSAEVKVHPLLGDIALPPPPTVGSPTVPPTPERRKMRRKRTSVDDCSALEDVDLQQQLQPHQHQQNNEQHTSSAPSILLSRLSEQSDSPASPNGRKKIYRKRKSRAEDCSFPDDMALEARLYRRLAKSNSHPQDDNNDKASSATAPDETATGSPDSASTGGTSSPAGSSHSKNESSEEYVGRDRLGSEWALVESIVGEAQNTGIVADSEQASHGGRQGGTNHHHHHHHHRGTLRSGRWKRPVVSLSNMFTNTWQYFRDWAKHHSTAAVEGVSRDSTYAIVTFTSRQAALAARSTLADGRGTERWIAMPELPIPPMADAAACDICVCRNCCRPVSMSINNRQKFGRQALAMALLATIYIFYTVPLTAASTLVTPERLDEICPNCGEWSKTSGIRITKVASGLLTAMLWTLFFSICPFMFKAIANFGSTGTSVARAEFRAMQYYWWFMVLAAFTSTLLLNMFLDAIKNYDKIGYQARFVLRSVAASIPSTMSATWLNWIIFRVLVILPLNYLMPMNAILFQMFGLKCCARMALGGGPGGPVPYRIYVDSGVVMMCALALAPQSPLVAPAAFVYFLVTQPLLRRNVIYMYRPKYDGGGLRWPFIFDMCISGLVVGQILLTTQMVLKNAFGPSIAAFLPLVPTFLFQRGMKRRFRRAYDDAALLQTSLLDGWNTLERTSQEQREEFRRFLVDAHKAAYVPICIAGTDTDGFLTAEPAVVVPVDSDLEEGACPEHPIMEASLSKDTATVCSVSAALDPSPPEQHGATLRRATHVMRRRASFENNGGGSSAGMLSAAWREKYSSMRSLSEKGECGSVRSLELRAAVVMQQKANPDKAA